jgi:ABC-type dipeptide/oligopeptide/nickel transport system permease subunit
MTLSHPSNISSGPDEIGQDTLSRLIYGTHSLFIGVVVISISVAVGVLWVLLQQMPGVQCIVIIRLPMVYGFPSNIALLIGLLVESRRCHYQL